MQALLPALVVKSPNISPYYHHHHESHDLPATFPGAVTHMNLFRNSFIISLLILGAACVSNQKRGLVSHERGGVIVKNILKIEGVKPKRGLIYKYNEKYPWMELKYYCVAHNATLNFTLETAIEASDDWYCVAMKDANQWCQFNAHYSVEGMKYEIELNKTRCPVFECVEDNAQSNVFYFTSVPIPSLNGRLVAAIYTVDDMLNPTSADMCEDEIRLAVMDLITSKEWNRKVSRSK